MPGTALAHDSLAPPEAPHQWLPDEPWVKEHRIPFDERRLDRVLDLRGGELEAYLFDDHHTLAALAERRGISVDALADYLVAPWTGRVSEGRMAELRDRTVRLLTQGHLAQHVFFHIFHRFGLHPVAPRMFGVNAAHLDRLRKRGFTPLQVASRHGGATRRAMIAALRRLVRARNRRAVAMRESWPSEARRMQARQLRLVPCWVRSLTPTADPGNPYGKGLAEHGPHVRGWPTTARERRIDEQHVETLRRHLQRSCWPKVHRWRWAAWLARVPRPEAAPPAAAAPAAAPAAAVAFLCAPARGRTADEVRVSASRVEFARQRLRQRAGGQFETSG
jgi:lambda repressor-like predicted transcriptional regulator